MVPNDLLYASTTSGAGMGLLSALHDPTVVYLLLLMAFYGLFIEFTYPGHFVSGTLGILALALALYAFQYLPISYWGLLLLVLGIGLMCTEAFIAFYGVIGIAGVVAFIAGSILLFDLTNTGYHLAWPLVIFMTVINGTFIFTLVRMVIKSRLRRPVTGKEALVGQIGIALTDFKESGEVRVSSEVWRARSEHVIHQGERVTVIAVDGLTLIVASHQGEHNG
jgi:membrane-bound serine protease (ClpP class)